MGHPEAVLSVKSAIGQVDTGQRKGQTWEKRDKGQVSAALHLRTTVHTKHRRVVGRKGLREGGGGRSAQPSLAGLHSRGPMDGTPRDGTTSPDMPLASSGGTEVSEEWAP